MVRPATPEDASAIAALFHRTVRLVNSRDYTPAQVTAWSGPAPDPDKWLRRQATRITVVEEVEGVLRGFAEYQPGGLVDALYVSAGHQRQGVGESLLRRVEAEAGARGDHHLRTEASITAVPFFTANGWSVESEQSVSYQGDTFQNFLMTKTLNAI